MINIFLLPLKLLTCRTSVLLTPAEKISRRTTSIGYRLHLSQSNRHQPLFYPKKERALFSSQQPIEKPKATRTRKSTVSLLSTMSFINSPYSVSFHYFKRRVCPPDEVNHGGKVFQDRF
jgi:hypothetical protein